MLVAYSVYVWLCACELSRSCFTHNQPIVCSRETVVRMHIYALEINK